MSDRVLRKRHRQTVFANTYTRNLWGDSESRSGPGSSLAATALLRRELPGLLKQLGGGTLLDAGCGDFVWIREAVAQIDRYIGIDIVPDLIKQNTALYGSERVQFLSLDITLDPLPHADIILCRDCLIHLPTRHIVSALRNFRATEARYLLLTNDSSAGEYHDIPVGSFRSIDFKRSPFCFPGPDLCLDEDCGGQRQLNVWAFARIPDGK